MKTDDLRRRVERLEKSDGGDVTFTMADGSKGSIRRKQILDAVTAATRGEESTRANLLRHAVSASDGSRLHEVVQAMEAGPVPRGVLNPEENGGE